MGRKGSNLFKSIALIGFIAFMCFVVYDYYQYSQDSKKGAFNFIYSVFSSDIKP